MNGGKDHSLFHFKQFCIMQDHCTMKVNTDGVLLGAWAEVSDAKRILDIGTGTGLVALMAAQRAHEALVVGIEIDEASYLDAVYNAKNSPFSSRLDMVLGSIQEYGKEEHESFDVIIRNPPFFTGGTFSSNENKANVRHAIKLPHGDLLDAVNRLLSAAGVFTVILPYTEGIKFIELAEKAGLFPIRIAEVRPRPLKPIERLLISLARNNAPVIKEEFSINSDEGNEYSERMKQLTKDFYINL